MTTTDDTGTTRSMAELLQEFRAAKPADRLRILSSVDEQTSAQLFSQLSAKEKTDLIVGEITQSLNKAREQNQNQS